MEAVHWTSTKIEAFKDVSINKSQSKTGIFGKPVGFWYAYGDAWKIHIADKEGLRFKYVFHLKDQDFTLDINENAKGKWPHETPLKILKLNSTNLEQFFKKFWNKEDYTDNPAKLLKNMKEIDKYSLATSGGPSSALSLLDRYRNKYNNYENEYNEENNEYNNEENGEENNEYNNEENGEENNEENDEENAEKIIREVEEKWRALTQKEKREYRFPRFNWYTFWSTVSKFFAGVEFDPDLFGIQNIKITDTILLDLYWIQDIEILSGVIFKPNTFFMTRIYTFMYDDIKAKNLLYPTLSEPVKGGRRRTIKHKKQIGRKKSIKRRV